MSEIYSPSYLFQYDAAPRPAADARNSAPAQDMEALPFPNSSSVLCPPLLTSHSEASNDRIQRYERGLLGHCLSVFQLPHRLPFRDLYKSPISYVSRRSPLFPPPLCRLCPAGLLAPTQCAPLPMLSRFNAVAHETSARHGRVQGKHQKLFRCSYRLARVLSPLDRTSSRLKIYAACMGDY